MSTSDTVEAQLESATKGFDYLFNDDVQNASKQCEQPDSHQLLLDTDMSYKSRLILLLSIFWVPELLPSFKLLSVLKFVPFLSVST